MLRRLDRENARLGRVSPIGCYRATPPSKVCYRIRLLSSDDIPAGLNLCRTVGWNQTREDWCQLISHSPKGCFAATHNDQVIGTVTSTVHGDKLAWIGMMLVDPDHRRKGVATELMNAAIEHLNHSKIYCIRLDATPAGAPVYDRLGFVAEFAFNRMQRITQTPSVYPRLTRSATLN